MKYPATTPEQKESYGTVLHYATLRNKKDLVRQLFQAGAAHVKFDNTPLLHRAVDIRSPILVSILLAHGCNPMDLDKNNYTALQYANYMGYTDIQRVLLANGTDYKPWFGASQTKKLLSKLMDNVTIAREFYEHFKKEPLKNHMMAFGEILLNRIHKKSAKTNKTTVFHDPNLSRCSQALPRDGV